MTDNAIRPSKVPFLLLNDKSYKLEKKMTIGSAQKVNISIQDKNLAPKHCIFRVQNNVVSIMDLGSKAGTMVERKRLESGRRVLITEDDELQIADCYGKIVFKSEESEEATDSIRDDRPKNRLQMDEPEPPPASDLEGFELEEERSELKIEMEGQEENVNEEVHDEPDQDIFDIEKKLKIKEETNAENLDEGYELSFNDKPASKMGTILTKMTIGMANLKQKLHLGSAPDQDKTQPNYPAAKIMSAEEEDVDPDVLNENTVILGNDGGVPIREKLRKLEEQKQVNKTSTKNLLQNIRKESGGKTNKFKIIAFSRVAGVNFRLLAVILDVFLVSALMKLPSSQSFVKQVDKIKDQIPLDKIMASTDSLKSLFEFLPKDIRAISIQEVLEVNLSLIIAYFLFRIFTTFIFGVSFGQYLFGLRSLGGLVRKRLTGTVRASLEPLLSPFLIFDLPCLLKKPTLKEIISRSGVQWDSRISAFLTILILCPLIAIYSFRSEIVGYVPSLKETHVTKIDTTNYTAPAEEKINIDSSYFRFNSVFKNYKGYWIYPTFKVQRVGRKNLIAPLIYVYHPKSGWEAELSVHKDFKMKGLAQNLGNTIEWLDENERTIISSDKYFRKLSSQVEVKDRVSVENFWRRTISLHWKNLFNEFALAKTGIASYYLGKKYFWEYLNIDQEMNVERLGFKNLSMFLISAHKQETPMPMKTGFLVPLTGGDMRIYSFNWSKRKSSDMETLRFLYNLFYEADFNFMNVKSEALAKDLNFLNALDTLAKTKADLKSRTEAGQIVFDYYKLLIEQVVKEDGHRKAKKRLLKELDKIKLAISLTGKQYPEWVKEAEDQIDFLKEKFGKDPIPQKDPNEDF